MDIPLRSEDVGHCSLRRYALDKVCSCLASADPAVRAALFSRLCGSCLPAPSHPYSSSGGAATAPPAAAAVALAAVPPAGDEGSSVGIPSSIGDSIISRTGEMGCQTTSGILDLLRWCTPRVLDLEGVSPAVTDSLLLRYPGESCAMLEEVCLGWCPHLLEVEALLLKIRNAGVDGQEDEACALRVLDVGGSEGLSDGILKALAGRCPALSTLKIDACQAVTGAFLPRLAKGCPSLAQLSADACTGITDAAVSNFIMESEAVASGSLHSLRLGGCPIGSLTAQALLMRGSCLLELNLDGCSGFGDAAVRMVCRACPGLLELSLLGCSTLTSRGAWHCAQHPSVETLAITLSLLPGPEPIPPAPEKPRRRAAGGGGGHRGDQQHRDAEGEARAAAGVRNGEGVAGAAAEQWACSRCTLLNAERRSTCQACRTPRSTREPPTPPPRPGTSPPASGPLPVSPGSSNGGRRRRGRSPSGSPSRSRSPAARKTPTTPECAPFPLPAVPPSGRLRRLCLELQPAAAGGLGAVQDDGGGVRSNPSNRASPAAAARCAFPLRRLAPLLPPGLTSLEVWSANARPVPRSVQRDATSGDRKRPIGRRLGRRGGSSSGGAWRMTSAAADGDGETPAGIEGAGSSSAKGAGRGRQRSGGGGGDDGDDGDASEGVASGVAVLAGPGDLLSVSQASPSLQELVVSGDPEQAAAAAGQSPSGVRIRGRGADAHTTTATAGVHATAAAIAYFLSCLGSAPPPPSTTGDNRGSSGSATSGGGGGGGGGGFSSFDSAGTTRPSPPSPLRLLAIFDCPSVPPMAVLEALAVQGGAGLDHVAVGVSHPPQARAREGVDAAGLGFGLGDDGGRVTLSSETLKNLHVSGEAALGAVALRCPRLEGVEFVNCPRLGEVEVTATPYLVAARVQNCGVGSGALVGLTKACRRLETLDVSGSSAVGDQVLLSALVGCPRLKTLRANGCRDVGGSPLLLPFLLSPTAAAPPPPPTTTPLPPLLCRLEAIAVSHAPGLTGAHLAALAGALPLLRRLSVSHCRGLIEVAASSGRSGDGVTGVVHGGGGGGGGRGGGPEGCGFGDTDRVDPGRGARVCIASGGEEDGEDEDREERLKTETAVENDGAVSVEGDETGGGGGAGGDGRATRSNGGDEGRSESSLAKGKGTKRRQRRLEDAQQRAGANSEGAGERRERSAVASAADCDTHDHDNGSNTAATASGDESGRRFTGDENVAATNSGGGRGEPRLSRKDARAAAKKKQGAAARHQGRAAGAGDARDAPAAEPIAAGEGRGGRGKRGGGKRGQGDEDDDYGGDGGDVCQGLEFRVDGKTRDKLERLAAALPREPGRKKMGRPSCIRFLQDKCPNSARDCSWAHLPMHPPKTLKFKPLVTHAQEPVSASSSSTKRNVSSSRSQPPPPPPQALAASRSRSPRSRRPDGGRCGGNGAGSSATVFEAAAGRGERAGVGGGGGGGGRGFERAGGTAGFESRRDGSRGGDGSAPEVCFKNLQFLEIHSCPGLKRLEGIRCPALAVARVTACRELSSLGLEEAFVLSDLDLAGCVRLESWELPPPAPPGGNAASSGVASSASLAELRVVVLNYCRGLQAKFLAKLVDHAKHLRRLEIYGAAAVVGPHPHGGSSSKTKKEQTAGKRDLSRVEFNRLAGKATAILKGLDKGRPKLVVVRTKKEFLREQEGAREGGN